MALLRLDIVSHVPYSLAGLTPWLGLRFLHVLRGG